MNNKAFILLILTILLIISSCSKGTCDNNKEKGYTEHEVLLTVASQKVEVAGLSQFGSFMAVKSPSSGEEWEPLYESINGFDYEEGYEYIISVQIRTYDNETNLSARHSKSEVQEPEYFLEYIFSKVKKESTELPEKFN